MSRPALHRIAALVAAPVLVLGLATASASGATRPRSSVADVGSLSSIACPTSVRCVAVGSDGSGNGKAATIDVASVTGTAGAGTVPDDSLFGVACATPTVCVAVSTDATAEVDVASGAVSLRSTLPAPTGEITALGRVACPSASECFAVGWQGSEAKSKAMVSRLSNTGVVESTIFETTSSGIGAIACPTATECLIAAADRKNPEKIQLLANGHFSTSHALPASTYVQTLACYRATVCYALGGKSGGSSERSDLLYEISPLTGAVMGEHTIGGGFSGDAMACGSADQCILTGFAKTKGEIVIATRGVPGAPRGVAGSLSGIAATDAGAYLAVGQNSSGAIVEKV